MAQVDVEKYANGLVEIAVLYECRRGRKQHAVVAGPLQQSRYTLQHSGVVIDDKNKVPIRHAQYPDKNVFCGVQIPRIDPDQSTGPNGSEVIADESESALGQKLP
jgi:hypothetical protein